jgi:hypothetical protein
MEAGDERDPADADHEPGDARGSEGLVGEETEAQERDEDRDRGLRNGGDARVDVGLAPGDERHREGGIDETEDEAGKPGRTELAERPSHGAGAHGQIEEEQDAGDEEPDVGHRGRRDVLDRDLDEQVGAAPDRREQDEERPVPGHDLRLASCLEARPFRLQDRSISWLPG